MSLYRSVLLLLWTFLSIYSTTLHENCNLCGADTDHILDQKQYASPEYRPPTVDVFLFVINDNAGYYISSGQFWVIPHAIKVLASHHKVNDGNTTTTHDCRIHIITDSDQIFKEGKEFGEPFYMYRLQDFDFITLPFKHLYAPTHHSVNSMDYEYLCFNRWHIMKEIAQTWNTHHSSSPITRILSLDLDVLMLQNVAKFVDSTLRALTFTTATKTLQATTHIQPIEADFDVIVIALGAINILSVPGLEKFSKYIYDWYDRTWEVVEAANAPYGKFFSDMMIMKEFLLTTSLNQSREFENDRPLHLVHAKKNACYEYWRTGDYYTVWRDNPGNQCLIRRLQCVPMSGYREMKQGKNRLYFQYHNSTETIKNLHDARAGSSLPFEFRGSFEDYPYCLMHFQGKDWKYLIPLYGQALITLHYTLFLDNADTEGSLDYLPPVIIRKHRSKELFLVKEGVKQLIPNMEAFEKYNLTHYPTYSAPLELFEFFLRGNPLEA